MKAQPLARFLANQVPEKEKPVASGRFSASKPNPTNPPGPLLKKKDK